MEDFLVCTLPRMSQTDFTKHAEQLGFSHHGVGDGPLLYGDPYAYLGAAVLGTSTINVGTWVTNPLTRIPAVTANAHASLNQLAPGRVFFGIGAANNATRSMGVRISRLVEIEDCIRQFRALTAGQRVTIDWLGYQPEIDLLADPEAGWFNVKDPMPIHYAAGGPLSLDMAAKTADVISYCTGTDPTFIRLIRRTIDEAAVKHGRDPKTIKLAGLTWFAQRKPGDTVADAMRDGFGNGPVVSAHTNLTLMRQHREELGDEIVDFAEAAAESYSPLTGEPAPNHLDLYRTHANGVISPRHMEIMTEYAADYFGLWGDPDQVAEKVQGMRDAGCDLPSVVLANPYNYERDAERLSGALQGTPVSA